ncbi:MAG: tail fiber domain-containing protein [Anaerolinea sp.]|nr:tail fiber domain-containing protein [Anaerolinea sp.]
MNKHILSIFIVLVLIALAISVQAQNGEPSVPSSLPEGESSTPQHIEADSTETFIYQGQLKDDAGSPINATCDFHFRLWNSPTASTGQMGTDSLALGVAVSQGYFTTEVNGTAQFGPEAFTGSNRWLEVGVRCPAGNGEYTTLSPRQPLKPAPIALSLPGLYTQQDNISPNIIGGYSGNSVSAGVYGATISGGGSSSSANQVMDNYGAVGGGIKNTAGAAASIGGGYGNSANGAYSVIGGGDSNAANGVLAAVGGGYGNVAGGTFAVVGGGNQNSANSELSTVSGGEGNQANFIGSTVGGGSSNWASGQHVVISGGLLNTTGGDKSTIGGGESNVTNGTYSTIPGGYDNTAAGNYSFAAGNRAQANHAGAFVWADSTAANFASTTANQFLIRAGGGVGIGTNSTQANGLTVNGRVIAGGTAAGVAGGEPFVARGGDSGISMDDRAGGTNPRWVIFPSGGTLNFWNGSHRFLIDGTGIAALGNVGSGGTTTLCRNSFMQISNCSSSARYKQNITSLSEGLDVIEQLRPVAFNWVANDEADLGLVAEEVAEIEPLLVTYNDAGEVEGVKYDRVSAVLVNAVQEQQAQIVALETQLAALEAQLAAPEAQFAAPEAQLAAPQGGEIASPWLTPWPWLASSLTILGLAALFRRSAPR